ncbi:MAG: phosphopantetheine adenylyltransferase [Candidatus Nezhaarchaeota archaeon]|nr:phosphopantetheine adenylyltransferase [Candidatus Nezhaarchaeota archaeon]
MKVKPFDFVAVGGTFDKLHRGHRELLKLAFNVGRRIIIGVTSDEMVEERGKEGGVEAFEERMRRLKSWIKEELDDGTASYEFITINDVYGTTTHDKKLEALIVSEETLSTALEINKVRVERGLKPLVIIVVPMILAYDGKPISSTRIRRGEINEEGNPAR